MSCYITNNPTATDKEHDQIETMIVEAGANNETLFHLLNSWLGLGIDDMIGDGDAPPKPKELWEIIAWFPSSALLDSRVGLGVGDIVGDEDAPPEPEELWEVVWLPSFAFFALQHSSKYWPRKFRHQSDPSGMLSDKNIHLNSPQDMSLSPKFTRCDQSNFEAPHRLHVLVPD